MLQYHQISCKCGRIHEVTKSQAGSSLTCECGKEIAIPTLRELRTLPVVEHPDSQDSPSLQRTAGVFQRRMGILFVLLVAAFLFAGLAGYYYTFCPKEPTVENAQTPFEVWQVWQTLRTGIDTPMDRSEIMRMNAIRMSWRWIWICCSASVLCVLGMFATLVIGVQKSPSLEKNVQR